MSSDRASFLLATGLITFRQGAAAESFLCDRVERVLRIEFGGDMIGPERGSFWIFDLGDSVVVAPDCPPQLRRDLLPRLHAPRFEGSLHVPPRAWSNARLLPPSDVVLKRITPQNLADELRSVVELRAVNEFGDEGL